MTFLYIQYTNYITTENNFKICLLINIRSPISFDIKFIATATTIIILLDECDQL